MEMVTCISPGTVVRLHLRHGIILRADIVTGLQQSIVVKESEQVVEEC